MTDDVREQAWRRVQDRLRALAEHIDTARDNRERLYRFADGFLALARDYHAVIVAEGKTSLRVEAALQALNLKTPKSQLLSFLGR